jgi:diguanylate cyclase (GGDEF)-like protein
VLRRILADRHVALAVATVLPVLAVEAVHEHDDSLPTVVVAVVYLAGQVLVARIPGVRASSTWHLLRFATAILFVALIIAIDGETSATLPMLYVPIVALAAAVGTPPGVVIAALALSLYVSSLALAHGWHAVTHDALVPSAVVIFVAIGTRLVVSSLERSLDRVRCSITADRWRARRLRAIERVGRILAEDGSSPAGLEAIMDVLVGTFGFQYPSLYLWNGGALRLGAQRGYEHPILEFDLEHGIIGRVARTREYVFAPDVAVDPDYRTAFGGVVSEIGVPLLSDGELLGVLNVESTGAEPLDRDDLASLRLIADRLSAAIALGRGRGELAERAALLGRLTEAFAELGSMLEPGPLHAAVARTATTVVRCDVGVLSLVESADGAARIAAAQGAEAAVGMLIGPGEGAAGRAIALRAPVLDDRFDRARFPRAVLRVADVQAVAVMAVPIIRDQAVLGAVSFVRWTPGDGFTEQEREIAGLFAAQAALALSNASLHSETREAAIRDPLTGLHNRRVLDDTLARLSAARARQLPDERRPVAAILFDLDKFGDLNKLHGHAAGDAVLRSFAGLLGGRFRASDLVARYGGEEFLVVLDGASRDDAVRAAEAIRVAFGELDVPVPGDRVLRGTVSAGCAALDPTIASLDTMVEVADVGLIMAKSGGRNQVVAA